MLSRRLLRVKVMQEVTARRLQQDNDLAAALVELRHSVDKSHELYHYLLLLPVTLRRMAAKKIEIGLAKMNPTAAERDPNKRFARNRLILALEENKQLQAYVDETGISWSQDDDMVKTLFNKMLASETYRQYMEESEDTFLSDRQFVAHYMIKELPKMQFFFDFLEEKSIYWNDEAEYMLSLAVKTIRDIKSEGEAADLPLMPLYKEPEDEEFAETLLRRSMALYNEGFELVRKYAVRWEAERILQTDIILIIMAMAEMTAFHHIPIKVTLNEYIEIAKFYSGEKSPSFINGIMENIIKELREQGRISEMQIA